ncbi:MAG TPA: cytochrome d ubiquinol oxidase subunit II, partial [Candidatus Angelobacter sp.]|nr:cytochrome d ubiquinol oxidase subunit II [Candidatus Angelobacter sp.]
RSFFDGCFFISSLLLTIFYGAALGNVIRGVPLRPDGYFFLPLWTDWRTGPEPGVLDWYTTMAGLVALVALTTHGAHYVALKTEGELNLRARRVAVALWPVLLALTLVSLWATLSIRPELLDNYKQAGLLFAIPGAVAASLVTMRITQRRGADKYAFISSSAYLVFMLVGAAAAVYPNLLTSSSNPALNITVYNAATGIHSLSIGLIWWSFGMALAVGYFVFVYRMFRGKISHSA